ncbi:MAG TPA: hypothetical protein VLH86_06235 [Patescibacteria group bacterium]|nr:hypothetical protein [Patescibacteria group bacterium]
MKNFPLSAERIVLDYPVDPADVCGGVLVNETEAQPAHWVAVSPRPRYDDAEYGHSLTEYEDADGQVRACLLSVPAGGESPVWHILPDAGDGKYYEEQSTVAGSGTFDAWLFMGQSPEGQEVYLGTSDTLPELPAALMTVLPGELFRVQASRDMGVHVLATFPGAPFELCFEERVPEPQEALI